MKLKKRIICLIVLLILFGLPIGAVTANQSIQSYGQINTLDHDANIDNEIVVIYQNQGSVKDLGLTTNQIEAGEKLSDQVDILKVKDGDQVDALVSELSDNPNVLAAQKNTYLKLTTLPNDELLSQAWQFEAIGADQTWDQVNNNETVVIAVIDSGLNINHPDIVGKTTTGYDYVEGKTETVDLIGHGTAMSGYIAAVANNEIGIAGVTGTANIKIAPYRVGGKTVDDYNVDLGYACAALYAAANRPEVRVINMSFAGDEVSPVLEAAVAYAANAGKILVAAAGNDGNDPVTGGNTEIPSAYDNVISVGATDQDNVIADFSQHNEKVDFCAPGVDALTLWGEDEYISGSGTSASSPIVAGACAVLVAADVTLKPAEVETILKDTAIDLGETGRDNYYGDGLIQLDQALAQVTPKERLTISEFSSDVATGQPINTPIVLNAVASGGTGDYSYAFSYELNGETTMIQDFSKADAVTFIPTSAGIYSFRVTVKDADDTVAQADIVNYVIENPIVTTTYRTQVQNKGWLPIVTNGEVSGTEGESLRLEAIELHTNVSDYNIGVRYKTQVENQGWQDFVENGALSGTEGESLRLEAIKIELTGADADLFDVYYQVHIQNLGWMDWAKNGNPAGSEGFGCRLEGIRIQVVLKGSKAPGNMAQPFVNP
ncbi:S8 family serine peptidase [Acetobacterium woodii]|uniref:Putative serine protease n=1 Tax=Acetobacterium woodii (strain ATCC 29683 / DSM 1030 / JCM 2381 / KCTC 1655 / WB1) TaxID=931626 RepID=H6LIL6_ACEWD|nr:S8 family serine peptidase [Acetobacterium woodii]AFA48590.1 putative serine protease [Acetobacterium woodii DSM 1030]